MSLEDKFSPTTTPCFPHHLLSIISNPIACHSFFFLFFSFFSFFLTPQIQCCQCAVHFKHFTQWFCSFVFNPVGCYTLFILSFSHHFLSSSHHSSSDINVFLTLSISLIDFAPSTPIKLTVIHSFFSFTFSFLSSSHARPSDINVVFTFSISLYAFAPSSPIPVLLMDPVVHSFLLISLSFPLFLTS